jgi:hypothetical protein
MAVDVAQELRSLPKWHTANAVPNAKMTGLPNWQNSLSIRLGSIPGVLTTDTLWYNQPHKRKETRNKKWFQVA